MKLAKLDRTTSSEQCLVLIVGLETPSKFGLNFKHHAKHHRASYSVAVQLAW